MNNNTTTYTLIAYRADGYASSMGCCTGTSSSDHEIHIHRKLAGLVEPMAKLMLSDLKEEAYCAYEFTLLSDGERSGDRAYFILFTHAKLRAQRLFDEYNAAKQAEADARKKADEERRDVEGRALYLHLQEKYGDKQA